MSPQHMTQSRPVLVTGARGMLGSDLCDVLRSAGWQVISADLADFDLTNRAATTTFIFAHQPQVIINCAAYTAVDQAESDPDTAFCVNRDGVRYIAQAAAVVGAFLFHISTDYVFDGTKADPYMEDDLPNPTSVYGQSKLAGEEAVRATLDRCCIMRTAWLFGLHGKSFPRTILSLASEGKPLRVVNDQRGCPTYTVHLAKVLAAMIARPRSGIYHAVNSGNCTWYELACFILKEASMKAEITPITTAEFPRPAPRPANSVLDTTKLQRDFGLCLPDWRQGVREFVALWQQERLARSSP